ncbi:MAG: HdeD family acid-resistance protein [Halofilum sp. (in: g-proteobacteria)]
MTMSLEEAARAMREAMRETVRRHSLWYLIQGGLMGIGGVVALLYPVFSSFAVTVVGWVLIISGLSQAISLIGAAQVPHFWIQLISVVLSLIIGWLLLIDPQQGLTTLSFLFIVFLMVEGVSKAVFALTIRPFPHWNWVLGSGLLGVVLSLLLLSTMPVSAFWILGALLGLQLMSEGAALGYLAWQARAKNGAVSSHPT